MFKVENVTCAYDHQILFDPFSCTINNHDRVLIQGKNGIGKTTLLRCLLGLHPHHQGHISFDHKSIDTYQRYQIGQLIGYVHQQPSYQLFGMSVWQECILFAQWRKQTIDEDEIICLLNQLNLYHLRDQHPQLCSRGEQQRLSLAIALLQKPRFILLDEPSTALDDKNVEIILDVISQHTEIGWIVVSHDQRLNKNFFNQIITLDKLVTYE